MRHQIQGMAKVTRHRVSHQLHCSKPERLIVIETVVIETVVIESVFFVWEVLLSYGCSVDSVGWKGWLCCLGSCSPFPSCLPGPSSIRSTDRILNRRNNKTWRTRTKNSNFNWMRSNIKHTHRSKAELFLSFSLHKHKLQCTILAFNKIFTQRIIDITINYYNCQNFLTFVLYNN